MSQEEKNEWRKIIVTSIFSIIGGVIVIWFQSIKFAQWKHDTQKDIFDIKINQSKMAGNIDTIKNSQMQERYDLELFKQEVRDRFKFDEEKLNKK